MGGVLGALGRQGRCGSGARRRGRRRRDRGHGREDCRRPLQAFGPNFKPGRHSPRLRPSVMRSWSSQSEREISRLRRGGNTVLVFGARLAHSLAAAADPWPRQPRSLHPALRSDVFDHASRCDSGVSWACRTTIGWLLGRSEGRLLRFWNDRDDLSKGRPSGRPRSFLSHLHEAASDSNLNCRGPVVHIQLPEDILHVNLHRALGDPERGADFLVSQPLRDQLQYFDLA